MIEILSNVFLGASGEAKIAELAERLNTPFDFVRPDGTSTRFGAGAPQFRIELRTERALRAALRLDALALAEAYMDREMELQGDLFATMRIQEHLGDHHPWVRMAARLEPLLLGRERSNPRWIALHYDSGNAQLLAADRDYNTYTPGVYLDDDDSLEMGAERKLSDAFNFLGLRAGDHLLEVGSGWGGMLRYAARRGVRVTGITLSRHQKEYCDALIKKEGLPAQVLYQDFFTFRPNQRFDAISGMGVMEDLSDYRRVMQNLAQWIKPGKRIYFDFAAERKRFDTHSFITQYIWPGTFRMIFFPEFIEAVRESPFELMKVENDRRNYYLWCRKCYERWVASRDAVIAQYGERIYRMYLLLFVSVSANMNRPSHTATAYRVVLEMPDDSDGQRSTPLARQVMDGAESAVSSVREMFLHNVLKR